MNSSAPSSPLPPSALPTLSPLARLYEGQEIRTRCQQLFRLIRLGGSPWFSLDEYALDAVIDKVAGLTRQRFGLGPIPFHSRWRHLSIEGQDRWQQHASPRLSQLDKSELARVKIDFIFVSVLLDAGAGANWRFQEPRGGAYFARSEGLALASFYLFLAGALSGQSDYPLCVDADGLARVRDNTLIAAFQVRADNPLTGLSQRVILLRNLAKTLRDNPDLFGNAPPRPGHLYDYVTRIANNKGQYKLATLAPALIKALAPIWPQRLHLYGQALGDVWPHPGIETGDDSRGLVPFHKLSQWLLYSVMEPLAEAGLTALDSDYLTGLAEYRNGGLFIDAGVLRPSPALLALGALPVSHPAVVEWRAATIILLDRVAGGLRQLWGMDAQQLPLASVLEGGTWLAGRQLASEKRSHAAPPLEIESDGTVF
jgi:Protein of unknown function (DUF1688)